jgi:hypothetical protein
MATLQKEKPINFENLNVIQNCKIIELPKIHDPRGNLSFIEGEKHFQFEIKSAYWIYDMRNGKITGGQAFKQQNEMIVALSGSMNVVVDDGTNRKIYSLNRPYYGLYIPSGLWYQMENFSTNSLILVLSSDVYFEKVH